MDNTSNVFREIVGKSDIVKVIAYYLGSDAIVKAGRRFKAICPFHPDSHPSMQIDPEKNFYHCFSCNAGGDTIKFVQEYAHLSSVEALKKVCEICGVPVPSHLSDVHEKRDPLKEKFPKELEALGELSRFYSLYLQSTDGFKGREYLSSRSISRETIDHFRIGYSPYDPTIAIASLRRVGFDVPTLERAGILSNSAELKDRYSGRIMFPLSDNEGHIVGFSGRKIDDKQEGGKYINYPETALFRKGDVLYHFDKARESARRDGYIYLLEGFMDVIAMQRAGLLSSAGLMGTALTENHLAALKGLGVECRLLLDSDEAGQLGEERALPLLLKAGIPTRVCWKLTGAKDADELLTSSGPEELVRQVSRLYSPALFLLGRALKGRKSLLDGKEIELFIENSRPYILKESEIVRAKDIQTIAKRIGVDAESLERIYARTSADKKEVSFAKKSKGQPRIPDTKKRFSFSLAGKYTGPDALEKLFGYLREMMGEGYREPELYRQEYSICIVLPQSRDAYETFRRSRVVFDQEQFNVFADLVGNVYLENPSLKSFSSVEYDSLLKALREDASEVGVDSDDPFDLDGLDTDRIDLSDEKKAFLAQFVEILMNLKTTTWYDPRKFAGSLVLEKCLLALSRFKEASAMRHSSSEEETPEEQETRRHLEHEVKKAKQRI